MSKEIGFKDLSAWIKLAVIGGHIAWISFGIGFIFGLMGY